MVGFLVITQTWWISRTAQLLVPPDALRAPGGIGALTSFVPCTSARSAPRNKALHLTARPSSLRLAVRSAGERPVLLFRKGFQVSESTTGRKQPVDVSWITLNDLLKM